MYPLTTGDFARVQLTLDTQQCEHTNTHKCKGVQVAHLPPHPQYESKNKVPEECFVGKEEESSLACEETTAEGL